jgi:hypothetical protein
MTPTDDQVQAQIIRESVAAYQSTGNPCAYPYNSDGDGSRCGTHSAYIKPNGVVPLCYASDVTDEMVTDWRHRQ